MGGWGAGGAQFPSAFELKGPENVQRNFLVKKIIRLNKHEITRNYKKSSAYCACDIYVAQPPWPNPLNFEFLTSSNFKEFVVRAFRI